VHLQTLDVQIEGRMNIDYTKLEVHRELNEKDTEKNAGFIHFRLLQSSNIQYKKQQR
jgi:hypothetical protein